MNNNQGRPAKGRNVVVVGTQWGDEGKGKIVDLDDHEARTWSLILRDKLQLLKEEFA